MRNKIIYGVLSLIWVFIAIMIYINKVEKWQFWIIICAVFLFNNILKEFKIDIFKSIRQKYYLQYIFSIIGIILLIVYIITRSIYFVLVGIIIGMCGLECMDKEKYIK